MSLTLNLNMHNPFVVSFPTVVFATVVTRMIDGAGCNRSARLSESFLINTIDARQFPGAVLPIAAETSGTEGFDDCRDRRHVALGRVDARLSDVRDQEQKCSTSRRYDNNVRLHAMQSWTIFHCDAHASHTLAPQYQSLACNHS
jgi:hypothetical protein